MPACVLKRLLIGLILVAAGLHAANESAGDARAQRVNLQAQGESDQNTSGPDKSDQGKSDSSKESDSESEESFTPSEKISEDFSVSFPIDI